MILTLKLKIKHFKLDIKYAIKYSLMITLDLEDK